MEQVLHTVKCLDNSCALMEKNERAGISLELLELFRVNSTQYFLCLFMVDCYSSVKFPTIILIVTSVAT